MSKRWVCLAGGVAVYGALVVYADPLLLFILVGTVLLWIAAPIAAVALVILAVAAISGRWLRPPLLLLSAVVVMAGVAALMLPINGFIQKRAEAAAKAYPDRVAPLLEEYRREHGAYPASLDQLASRPHVPRLLRSGYGYRSDGSHYTFTFAPPGGVIDVWRYYSETHAWHLST